MADNIFTVLGIDTGFRHVGYSLVAMDALNELKLIDYGYWDLMAEHTKMNRRSFKGMKTLHRILSKYPNTFDAICLETVPPTRFNGRDATLASTNMFRAYSIFNDKLYSELHSMTIKKGITGSGKADKDSVKESVIEQFPELPEDLRYDVYDAIAAAVVAHKQPNSFWDFAA